MTRQYDATVARIAGNIAAGLVTLPAYHVSEYVTVHEADTAVMHRAIALARAIVAETIKTEPQPDAVDPHLHSEPRSSTRDQD
jgi:hypothetical protein